MAGKHLRENICGKTFAGKKFHFSIKLNLFHFGNTDSAHFAPLNPRATYPQKRIISIRRKKQSYPRCLTWVGRCFNTKIFTAYTTDMHVRGLGCVNDTSLHVRGRIRSLINEQTAESIPFFICVFHIQATCDIQAACDIHKKESNAVSPIQHKSQIDGAKYIELALFGRTFNNRSKLKHIIK